MTDDIAGLAQEIVKLHEDIDSGADIPIHLYKMAKAALTTPSMTDDIAGLVERLRKKFSFYRDPDNAARWIAHERHLDEDCAEAAVALRALAQENEKHFETERKLDKIIGELEAERDLLRKMKDRALESAALNGEALKQCQLLLCPDFEKCAIIWFETCLCGFEDGRFANAVPKNRSADAIRAKTIALLDKLDAIEADKSFQGIWPYLHVHGYVYSGPSWKDEVAALRALAQTDESKTESGE